MSAFIDSALIYYNFWKCNCAMHAGQLVKMASWKVQSLDSELQNLWDGKAIDFKNPFFKGYITDKSISYQSILESGLQTDARKLLQEGDEKSYKRFASLRKNVWEFGAGSVQQEYKAIGSLMEVFKNEGRDLAEEDVFKQIKALQDRYQIQFKQVEDELIEASGIMARKWDYLAASGNSIKYVTVGDSHVRFQHAKLDGIVLPADDPFWDKYYPPIGYGCRCDAQESSDKTYTGKIPEVPTTQGVSGNVGKSGVIYTDKHPYMKNKEENNSLSKDCLSPALKSKYRQSEYRQQLQGKFVAKSGEEIVINKSSISDTLHHSGNDPIRIDLVNILPEITQSIEIDEKHFIPTPKDLDFDGLYKIPFNHFGADYWMVIGKNLKGLFVKCINNEAP